jgi:hypothetical protein
MYLSNKNVITFSIQTNISNKRNDKFFLLSIQYFSIKNYIENKLIDFYENHKLSLQKVFALSAGNSNCNFGKNYS